MANARDQRAYLNRSVAKAASLLFCFSAERPELTLKELAELADLPKPTAHRYAVSLAEAGLMLQTPSGAYRLGHRLIDLGAIARTTADMAGACRNVMQALAHSTEETVLLGVMDWSREEIVIVERIHGAHLLSVGWPVGRRTELHGGLLPRGVLLGLTPEEAVQVVSRMNLRPRTRRSTTSRRELLQQLADDRERGYCIERGEFFPDVSGVSVPVIYEGDRPICSMALVGPTARLEGNLEAFGRRLVEATRSLRHASPDL